MHTKMKLTAGVLSFALVLGQAPDAAMAAAKKTSLNTTRLTLKTGERKTLRVKNAKTKVTWSVRSGKKCVTLKKKGKVAAVVQGRKKGTARVQAKAGKKKMTCKITVRNAVPDSHGNTSGTAAPQGPAVPGPTQAPQTNPSGPSATTAPSSRPGGDIPPGSHAQDVAALKKLIAEQKAQETSKIQIDVSEDLSSDQYTWENGRLTGIRWTQCNVRGNLSFSELPALTHIEVWEKIPWRKLESFDVSKNTALTYLNCCNNLLSSLDVSNNTALTILRCSGNELTSLDVSKNTALTELDCGGNGLTALDVSNNTALTELWCNANHLASLDVSNNTELTELGCTDNQMFMLDVISNPNLRTLHHDRNVITIRETPAPDSPPGSFEEDVAALRKLIAEQKARGASLKDDDLTFCCSWSASGRLTDINWAGLGLSGDISFSPFKALTELDCSENELTSLDVSGNTALARLQCSENHLTSLDLASNKALTELYCSKNQLIALDVSANTELISLQCLENQLEFLDVSKNKKMKYNVQYDYNVIFITKAPEENSPAGSPAQDIATLKKLIAEQKAKGASVNEDITNTQYYWDDAGRLKGLYWDNCGLSGDLSLPAFPALASFSCEENNLASLDTGACTALSGLTCSHNQLTSLEIGASTALTYLDCQKNQLTELNVSHNTALTKLICYDNQLELIDVSKNKELVSGEFLYGFKTVVVFEAPTENSPAGSPAQDVAALKKLIAELKAQGASVDEDIKSSDYQWGNDGRLKRIYWPGRGLSGDLSFSAFPALTELWCYENELTSLDVSNNTALTFLNCGNNQLSSLDISKNTALKGLYCSDNQLTALNTSANPALISLNCSGNELDSLDISGSTSLTNLNCQSNPLGFLDISKNKELTSGEFIHDYNLVIAYEPPAEGSPAGSGAQDVTALRKLIAEQNAKGAHISDILVGQGYKWGKDGRLNKISLYDCNMSGDISFSTFTALTSLSCSQNQVTSLDVSGNALLTHLYCNDNQLTNLDVSKNTALTTLNCSRNQLTNLDVSKNTALTTLDCSDNQLADIDVSHHTALTKLLCENNPLETLDVSHTALTSLTLNNKTLTVLNASGNTALTNLDCSGNQLTQMDLSGDTALTDLNCSHNQLTQMDLSGNTALSTLKCSHNQLTSLDLSSNLALTNLYCPNNQLTNLNVSKNTALTDLYCPNNQLTNLDVSKNTALTGLNCRGNSLTELDLSNNKKLIFETHSYLECDDTVTIRYPDQDM